MIKVGCCGFPTAMKRYFEKYRLVELNSTFYQYPNLETVKSWREKAPEDFEFTVKAHQDISHRFKMKANERCLESFSRIKAICEALRTKIMLIQTPASFTPDKLGDAEEFFRKIDREGLTLVWETRGPTWEKPEVRDKLQKMLEKLDIIHVTDPFKNLPVHTNYIAYFRLHGLDSRLYYYQYDNEELKKLRELIKPYEEEGKTVYVLFNNLSMFDDGARFMYYISTGKFPSIAETAGIDSIRKIIEKTRYPASKSTLIKKLGWRIVEVKEGKQIRIQELLEKLPAKTFKTAEELLKDLKAVFETLSQTL
ncbi:MAG: DUF72 domain-containing protein [Candidatus Bathyarchaeia archaeon]